MWKRDSPFYLRPRPAVLPWLARFALASRHSEQGATVIRELSTAGLELHAALGAELDTTFERTGTLNVYETQEGLEGETLAAARSGLPFEVFDADGTRALEPALVGPIAGSVRYPTRDASTRGDSSRRLGGPPPRPAPRSVPARRSSSLDELDAETVVVAAGAWSKRLVSLPLEGGKGYHVDFERSDDDPRIPVWVQETWTIATPFPDRLRLAGTLELAGLDLSVSELRVNTIRTGGERWFRGLRGRPVLETWAGLRPCLPDGLPAIGRLGRTVVATGHAMKGVALAPVTARLVAQVIAGEAADHDLAPLDPARF